MYPFELVFSFSSDTYPGVELLNHMIDKSKFWCEISKFSNETSIFLTWPNGTF